MSEKKYGFESLECWQLSRKLVKDIYLLTKNHQEIRKDFGLRDQMQRSAVSIMSNIAEGSAANSQKEFIKFLNYSCRSGAELKSLCFVCLDLKYFDNNKHDVLVAKIDKVIKLCFGLKKYLKHFNS